MKCPFMKHRELLEFLTYSPHASRYKLLKKVESKSDTLYILSNIELWQLQISQTSLAST